MSAEWKLHGARQFAELVLKKLPHILGGCKVAVGEIYMYDGIFVPFAGLVVNGETFEKLLSPLENGLQRRKQQRFSETSWARHEIHALRRPNQLPDVFRLIDIEKIALYQILECIDTASQVLLHTTILLSNASVPNSRLLQII